MKAIVRLLTVAGPPIADIEWPHANLHMEGDGKWFVVTQYKSKESVAIERLMWIAAERVFQAWLVPDE